MTEQLTTYRIEGKGTGLTLLFKYDLNGNLRVFNIVDGILDDVQMKWLYSERFPATEALIKSNWSENVIFKTKFDVHVSPADLSFDALWELYGYKVDRKAAEKVFSKLKEAEKIKCFISIPLYEKWLSSQNNQAKLYLSTYISKRRFDDEFPTIQQPYKKEPVGKVFNNALQDLAKKKTEK